jgi:hypothetical protein
MSEVPLHAGYQAKKERGRSERTRLLRRAERFGNFMIVRAAADPPEPRRSTLQRFKDVVRNTLQGHKNTIQRCDDTLHRYKERGHLTTFSGRVPCIQGQNIAVTVIRVPDLLDHGSVFNL